MSEAKTSWALSQIWNAAREVDRVRGYDERDHIWASELGGSYYDRYWKMHGRDPVTPPNLRAFRKFDAGNLTEWVVKQMLVRAHIYHSQQDYIINEEGDMKVTGKVDFMAGGKIEPVIAEDLPDVLRDVSESVLAKLSEDYPDGLPMQGLEIKSVSSFVFPSIEKAPLKQHALQAFHYAYNTKTPFHLVYISKDDLLMVEWVILPDSEKWKELYFEDIKRMAAVYKLSEDEVATEKEPLLLFDKESAKFKKNIRIEYSAYLPDYGFERPDQYSDLAKVATRLNNVCKSIVAGKKLSKLNDQAIELGVKFYPEVANILEDLKDKYKEVTVIK